MRRFVRRLATAAGYQLTVIAGLLLLPVAVTVRKIGVTLPMRRVVDAALDAYESER